MRKQIPGLKVIILFDRQKHRESTWISGRSSGGNRKDGGGYGVGSGSNVESGSNAGGSSGGSGSGGGRGRGDGFGVRSGSSAEGSDGGNVAALADGARSLIEREREPAYVSQVGKRSYFQLTFVISFL